LVQELAACHQKMLRGFRVERNEFREAAHVAKEEFREANEELLDDEPMGLTKASERDRLKRYRRKRDWLVPPTPQPRKALSGTNVSSAAICSRFWRP